MKLPPLYGITAVALFADLDSFLQRLVIALDEGLQLVQVRDKHLAKDERQQLAEQCLHQAQKYNCKVLINDDLELATSVGADGVHISSQNLANFSVPQSAGLVGASCHNAEQLATAFTQLHADFAVLSPVLQTLTHVDAPPLGWNGFAKTVEKFTQPIYALGGLDGSEHAIATQHGAAGLASMRAVWGLPVTSKQAA